MKLQMKKVYGILAFSNLLFFSCSTDNLQQPLDNSLPPPEMGDPMPPSTTEYTSGDADFSNFVAVGNSLTAGFSDNALFIDGQTASFPNMMASSFAQAGGGSFSIPFMADNLGGATFNGIPVLGNRLFLSFASGTPLPTLVEGMGTTETGPFNNLGVPGAKSYHLMATGYGNLSGLVAGTANPYYARIASSPNATVIGDAMAQTPTFFSLWIGNNDILSFATSGGIGINQLGNSDPSTYDNNDVTDPILFEQTFNGILQNMTTDGAKGVIANLPNVTSIPNFTTVPYNSIFLDEVTVEQANAAYADYNEGLAQLQTSGEITAEEVALRTISFSADVPNAAVIIDEDLTDLTSFDPALLNIRQATANDLMVLLGFTFIGTLADEWVLTPEEQTIITDATTAFNQTIANAAATYNLAFVDANAFLAELNATGITLDDGTQVTATFGTGGGFSLDGVHPSPRGYALLANKFIEEIEAKYGAILAKVSPEEFKGVYLD